MCPSVGDPAPDPNSFGRKSRNAWVWRARFRACALSHGLSTGCVALVVAGRRIVSGAAGASGAEVKVTDMLRSSLEVQLQLAGAATATGSIQRSRPSGNA